MQLYHILWLCAHPHRTDEWLQEKLDEGFDIHHLDGNKLNNNISNLILIEHTDHMMLHMGKRKLGRLKSYSKKGPRGPQKKTLLKNLTQKTKSDKKVAKEPKKKTQVRWVSFEQYYRKA